MFLDWMVELFLLIFNDLYNITSTHNILFEIIALIFSKITISSKIISGIVTGILLFLAMSVFQIKIDLDGVRYGEFSFAKFMRSLIYLPLLIGFVSKNINIELTYNDFLIVTDYLTTFLHVFNINMNQHWQSYFTTVIEMTPSALATIYFIKLWIFQTFWWLLYVLAIIHIFIISIKYIKLLFSQILLKQKNL